MRSAPTLRVVPRPEAQVAAEPAQSADARDAQRLNDLMTACRYHEARFLAARKAGRPAEAAEHRGRWLVVAGALKAALLDVTGEDHD